MYYESIRSNRWILPPVPEARLTQYCVSVPETTVLCTAWLTTHSVAVSQCKRLRLHSNLRGLSWPHRARVRWWQVTEADWKFTGSSTTQLSHRHSGFQSHRLAREGSDQHQKEVEGFCWLGGLLPCKWGKVIDTSKMMGGMSKTHSWGQNMRGLSRACHHYSLLGTACTQATQATVDHTEIITSANSKLAWPTKLKNWRCNFLALSCSW